MKKLITVLSVPVVLGVVWAGTSWYVGQQTESTLRQFIEQQNEQTSSQGVTQEVVSYEKGTFGAKAVTKLKFTTPPLSEMFKDIQFVNEIDNGPVFLAGAPQFGMSRINSRLDMDALDETVRKELEAAFSGKPPFESHAVLGFGGGSTYDVVVNPMKLDKDGTTIVMEGATLTGDSAADMTGKFNMQVSKVEIKETSSGFTMPSMQVDGNITGMAAGQALGSFDIKAPQVSIQAEGATEPFVFDMNVQTNSDIKNDEAEGTVKFGMANIKGAQDVLSKLDYSLTFQGLAVDGLKEVNRIQTEMTNMQSQIDWNAEAMETPEGQQKMQELMTNTSQKAEEMIEVIFTKVLKTDKSRMQHALMAESPKGKLNASIDLTYTGKEPPKLMEMVSYGPNDWAKMMKGKILLDADKAILPEGTDMMVAPLAEQGLLKQEGEKITAQLELAGENAILNGKQMPFADLLQLLAPNMGGGMTEEGGDMSGSANDMGIPEDLMQRIQDEGLTPEIMQMLEESDDVPPETLEMFKQLQQMQQGMDEGAEPAEKKK